MLDDAKNDAQNSFGEPVPTDLQLFSLTDFYSRQGRRCAAKNDRHRCGSGSRTVPPLRWPGNLGISTTQQETNATDKPTGTDTGRCAATEDATDESAAVVDEAGRRSGRAGIQD